MIDTTKLKSLVPDAVLSQVSSIETITSNLRLAHFLSQCAHESGNFHYVQENLFYSADGLVKVFPKYFTTNTAALYAKQPQKIANRVYSSRMGNGNENSGDGWKYHGRGYIQLTGKTNYQLFSTFIKEDCVANPDLVATKYPLASAAFFFTLNNLWLICDKGSGGDTILALTKRINGGVNGLDDRTTKFQAYYSAVL